MIGKYGRPLLLACCAFKQSGEIVSVENIIAEHQCHRIISDKFFTDDKCVRETSRLLLYCIGKTHAELASVSEKLLKHRQIPRCGDD